MKINGAQYLDDDNYSKILINESRIDILGLNQNRSDNENVFANSLIGKSDDEIITSIINYYLKHNFINYLGNGVVKSMENKKLMFNTNLNENIRLRIINKYQNDRLASLQEVSNPKTLLHISATCSAYDENGNYWLMYDNRDSNKLYDIEIKFLMEMLDMIFEDKIAYIDCDNGSRIISLDGNNVVNLTNPMTRKNMMEICNAVGFHNGYISKNNDKNKQLKLEVKNGK
jgi:hypothetical protein